MLIPKENKNTIEGIVFRPCSYNSEKTSKPTSVSWLSTHIENACWLYNRLGDHYQNWKIGVNNYQICLQLKDRKVISTGVTRVLMDRFIQNKQLSLEEEKLIRDFFQNTTDRDISKINLGVLQAAGQLLLDAHDLKAMRDALSQHTLFQNILHLPNAQEILKNLNSFPTILKLNLISKVITLPQAGKILNNLHIFPVTFKHLDQVFASPANCNEILWVITINSDVLISRLNPKLMDQILALPNAGNILQAIAAYPKTLKLDCDCLERIFALPSAENILRGIGKLQLRDSKLLGKILNLPNADKILYAFAAIPQILNLKSEIIDQILTRINAILTLPNPEEVLKALADYPHLLNLSSESIDRIFALPSADNILRNLGKLKLGESKHIKTILTLPDADPILHALAQNPEILNIQSDTLDKIFTLPNAKEIFHALIGWPEILESMSSQLQVKLFNLPYADKIILILCANSEILFMHSELVETILGLPNAEAKAEKILSAINSEILNSIQPELLNTIIFLPNAEGVLRTLGTYPKVLNQIEPVLQNVLQNVILSLPNAEGILNVLGQHSAVLGLMQPDLIAVLFTLPDSHKLLLALAENSELLVSQPDLIAIILPWHNAEKIIHVIGKCAAIVELKEPEFLYPLLNLPQADQILLSLAQKTKLLPIIGKHSKILGQIQPELLVKILSLPDAEKILKNLDKYHEIVNQPNILTKYMEIYTKINGRAGAHFDTVVFSYLVERSKQLEPNTQGPFLNYSKFLYDEMFSKCRLPLRTKNLNEENWQELREDLTVALVMFLPEDARQQNRLDALKWFDNMLKTNDAALDKQLVMKRVASVIDYIKKQETTEGKEIAKEVLLMLAEGGSGVRCEDSAALTLDEAELSIMASTKSADSTLGFTLNIIVNEYKRNMIALKFVDSSKRESAESALYYLTFLNKPFGLESQTASMMHEEIAVRRSLDEAMSIAYTVFSDVNTLIGYTQDHWLMQSQFKTDPSVVQSFEKLIYHPDLGLSFLPSEDLDKYTKTLQSLMDQAPSIDALKKLKELVDVFYYTDRDELLAVDYVNPNGAQILDNLVVIQLEKKISNFKTEKTISLLKKTGFLSDTPDCADPDIAYFEQ